MTRTSSMQALVLSHQRDALAREARLEGELDALSHARRGEPEDDEHDPDGASQSAQWSMLRGLLASARSDARAAEAARERIEADTYGICTRCRRAIPLEQLEVRPLRERCVACASGPTGSRGR